MAMLRRKTKDERRENCVILSGAVRRSRRISVALCLVLLLASVAFAAPKSASAYYGDAAFQYIENRLPTAEITCNEGLQYYPNDQKLQMLLDRIHEAKDEQKNENKKNDPKNDQNQDQNNQDQNQDQNQDKQNQDQNKDQQNQDQQNQDQNQNQNGDQSSSSAQNDQNQDQQNQGQNGQSSDSQQQSSDSNGGSGEQQQPEQSEGNSSDSNGSDQEQPQPLAPGELTPEEAAQLLKDFDEQNGERKPWKPVRGQVRPAKDW
ncbi:hypothetical protein [Fibrobacter sp. UWB12]|uniref:hypothetical protein n=1 Tax=Fibrobacter sp. UWB12 TaxID=1896203 RepID=UPI0009193D43|nr:hypothetical protein [Fibrobacter sp. UWB12]SHK79007.1 hypothetical protein SAMN05720759_106232 [Fibrobacter sp. UWB12]